ncbi:hypothetical protein [Cyclobacterium sp.]|uniref:hypothetical protein n=1 Tax=Cyclobacterium sp. TaxID=1966343 RepID=UPI0019AC8AF4|nr:hypothetical protein [Cyclobacterium sp.]MBD3627588.1 hypothetical protein [Cyclobacterium sp.]
MKSRILQILTRWTERTEMVLERERKRLKVGKSGELDRSFKTRVLTVSQDLFESQIDFLLRGRFVDMGAGRGRKIESQAGNRALLEEKSGRKPKKWYSRAYYGRLNDLQGVLGYQLMESAIQSIKGPLESK